MSSRDPELAQVVRVGFAVVCAVAAVAISCHGAIECEKRGGEYLPREYACVAKAPELPR